MLIKNLRQPEINSEFCVYQGTITLPVVSAPSTAPNDPLESCACTTLPTTTAPISPSLASLGPVTTEAPTTPGARYAPHTP